MQLCVQDKQQKEPAWRMAFRDLLQGGPWASVPTGLATRPDEQWAGWEQLLGPWSPAMQAREPAHCTQRALNKCSWLSKHTADGARGLSTGAGTNCPCLWPNGRWKAPGAGERGVPRGACPSPPPHPCLWSVAAAPDEHQGATPGVLDPRTTDSMTAHSILRLREALPPSPAGPQPSRLGGPE